MNKQYLTVCEQLIKYQTEHGKLPSPTSKNKQEKRLAKFLSNVKQAKMHKGTMKWNDEIEKLAVEAGYDGLFEIKNPELIQLEKVNMLIEWTKKNNKVPSTKSKDISEKKWANFLTNLKRGARNIGRSKLYPSSVELLKKSGNIDVLGNGDINA